MDKETLRLIGSICELVFDYVNAKQADLGLQEHIKDSMHEYYKELQNEIERLHNADDSESEEDVAINGQEALDDYVNLLFDTIQEVKTDDSAEFHDNKRPINCKCKRAVKKARTSCN